MTDPTQGRTTSAPNKDPDERRRTANQDHPEGRGFLGSIGSALLMFGAVPLVFAVGVAVIVIFLLMR